MRTIMQCVLFIGSGFLASCVNSKKVTYFPALNNDTLELSNTAPEPFIKNNDILSIAVSSANPDATTVFNVSTSSSFAGTGSVQSSSYLVSSKGLIQFPLLGAIPVAGLTKEQLADKLATELEIRKYLTRPIVTIRQLNFTVTILGEVGKPSVINVPSERISLLEAIGLAGDITIYGKKDNVLVIREENNQKITHRINLNSNDLFHSDFYYLKPNDMVYVEPKKAKIAESSKAGQWIPILSAVLTVGIVVIDRLVK